MAADLTQIPIPFFLVAPTDVPFVDKHFAKLAFTVATAVLAIFSSFFLFLGVAAGAALHYSLEPDLVLKEGSQIVTIPNAVFAVVGAFAALIRVFPAGAAGGFLFQAIPLIASFAVGSTFYRAFKSC